jgi:hypothetical protein
VLDVGVAIGCEEKYFNDAQMKWYLGLGIGFSINNIYGLKVFK